MSSIARRFHSSPLRPPPTLSTPPFCVNRSVRRQLFFLSPCIWGPQHSAPLPLADQKNKTCACQEIADSSSHPSLPSFSSLWSLGPVRPHPLYPIEPVARPSAQRLPHFCCLVFVPPGHPIIARRFNAGSRPKNKTSPGGTAYRLMVPRPFPSPRHGCVAL